MSIIKITRDLIEKVTLKTHPRRVFVSSSVSPVNDEPMSDVGILSPTGTLGQVSLTPRSNRVIKGVREFDSESPLFNEDQSSLLINLSNAVALSGTTTDIQNYLGYATDWPHSGIENVNFHGDPPDHVGYMKGVGQLSRPAKNSKTFGITRFRPPFLFQNDEQKFGAKDSNITSGSFEASQRIVKNQIRNILLPTSRGQFSHPNYAYTNYHSLNFFTSSNGSQIVGHGSTLNSSQVTTSSVLIYPCMTGTLNPSGSEYPNRRLRRFDGKYAPETAFTFDFYINPRYSNDVDSSARKSDFHAGTIYHMSSTYAVSLVTGSLKAADGSAEGFRILLQLSQSAEWEPSKFKIIPTSDRPIYKGASANYKTDPYNLAWVSPDNSLKRNHWHHVAIRWGPKSNKGTGSFVIDGKIVSEFYPDIGSEVSIRPFVNQTAAGARAIGDRFLAGRADPNALFIGNFYEGTNVTGSNATTIERFFNLTARKNEGFTLRPDISGWSRTLSVAKDTPSEIQLGDPKTFSFNHPLNAEVHDIKLYSTFRTISQIQTSSVRGPEDLSSLLFYVPPFFTYEKHDRRFLSNAVSSSRRQDFNDTGGALDGVSYPTDKFVQPYMSMPFNAGLSMAVDATLINLENFTKDIVNDVYPRLLFLTASSQADKTGNLFVVQPRDTINHLFQTASLRKRCLTVLPCDNGRFQPNYDLVYTGSDVTETIVSSSEGFLYRDDLGNFDPSLINLSDMFTARPSHVSLAGLDESYRISRALAYYTGSAGGGFPSMGPDNPYLLAREGTSENYFIAYQASRDPSSNEIVIFNIPNLFYGNRIQPGTFTLTDSNLSGSAGKVKITLKDDSLGSLYRADSKTKNATYNSVGNIFYDEGIVLIKSPHLSLFGKNQFKMEFNGDQNIHVMAVNVPCRPGLINSSSNPGFRVLSASLAANDVDSEFVYITGIYFHDDNMNVIMKVNLAQPAVKRDEDDFLFRVKMDF